MPDLLQIRGKSMWRSMTFLSVLLILACTKVFAETTDNLDLRRLTQLSDHIVVAECVQTHSYWERSKVFTRVSFSVSETLVGNSTGSVDVLVIGGTAVHPVLKEPVSMEVGEGVDFEIGQRSILFLKHDENGQTRLVGLNRGKLDIRVDEQGRELVPSTDKKLIKKQTQSGEMIDSESMTLEETLDRIRGYLDEQ